MSSRVPRLFLCCFIYSRSQPLGFWTATGISWLTSLHHKRIMAVIDPSWCPSLLLFSFVSYHGMLLGVPIFGYTWCCNWSSVKPRLCVVDVPWSNRKKKWGPVFCTAMAVAGGISVVVSGAPSIVVCGLLFFSFRKPLQKIKGLGYYFNDPALSFFLKLGNFTFGS